VRARAGNLIRLRKPAVFVLEDHIYYLFTQIVGRRNRHIADKLKPFGVTVPKWRVLAALHARPAVTMNQLAQLTTIDRTTLTRTLDQMARGKLIERRADLRDRRSVRLRLATRGEETFGRVLPLVMEDNALSIRGISPGEVAQFRRILTRIVDNLDRNYHARDTAGGGLK
jgi:DNA-binding MarR family transcriptional regulator